MALTFGKLLRWWWIAVAGIALAACATTQDAPESSRPAPIVTMDASCTSIDDTPASYSGTLTGVTVSSDGRRLDEGALEPEWELYLPARWGDFWFNLFNGGRRLVVFNQGTIDPYTTPNPTMPNEAFATYDQVVCSLLASDIAVAWTTNTEHGYDVEGAFEATKALVQTVKGLNIRQPDQWHEVGFSQGGLVGPMFAAHPDTAVHSTFDGHLSICAPLAGMARQIQYFGDVRVLFDLYLQNYGANSSTSDYAGVIPLGPTAYGPGFDVPDSDTDIPWKIEYAGTDGVHNFANINYNPDGTISNNVPHRIHTALMNDLVISRAFAANPAIALPAYTPDILAYSAIDALFYSVRGVNQMLRKAGGLPYSTGSSAAYGGAAPAVYVADMNAPNYVAAWATPGANLQGRVMTLHTTDDSSVPYWHETAYASLVGGSSNLKQQYARRIGHCAFTTQELETALNEMILWGEGRTSTPITGDITSTTDTPPVVGIIDPSQGATLAGNVRIRATADDDVGITHVDFYAGGVPLGRDDAPEFEDGRYIWEVTWSTSGNSTADVAAQAFEAVPSLSPAPASATDTISVTVQNDASPPSIDAFTASDTTVTAASKVTLSWSVSGSYTSLTLSDGTNPAFSVLGASSYDVFPSSRTIYTLTASDGTTTVGDSVTIDVGAAPTIVSFAATPASIEAGQNSTLAWDTTGAVSATLSDDAGNGPHAVAVDGSTTVSPIVTTIYTLTATNSYGSSQQDATLEVTEPPPSTAIELNGTAVKARGRQGADFGWSPADTSGTTTYVDLYRNDGAVGQVVVDGTRNDGYLEYRTDIRGGGTATFWICKDEDPSICSNTVTLSW